MHHGQNREYRDGNFGGTFLVWDKLFGSFQPELVGVPVHYGIAHPTASTNPFWANIAPLLRYVGARRPRLGNETNRETLPDVTIGAGGLVLFALTAYYIHRDGTWPAWGQSVFFMLVSVSTLALGGMSDSRAWGLPCWLGLGCTGVVVLPLLFGLTDPIGLVTLALLPLHGLATSLIVRAGTTAGSPGPGSNNP